MTGFGRGEATEGGIRVTVEIKTLNSRYLDISPRLPGEIQDKELELKELIQKYLSRGKVLLTINVDESATGRPKTTYNADLVKSYGKMLEELKFQSDIKEPVRLHELFKFDDIFETRQMDTESLEKTWNCTLEATKQALELLNSMRKKEGKELENELRKQLGGIEELLGRIKTKSASRAPELREKLHERITKMVSDEHFDPDRMEMEIALLADKMDVQEEVVRLHSHLKFFIEAMDGDEAVGRRLNFLCQEINRELNTIGSKASDSDIAHDVVIAKEKLEQIREQVQNIE